MTQVGEQRVSVGGQPRYRSKVRGPSVRQIVWDLPQACTQYEKQPTFALHGDQTTRSTTNADARSVCGS